MGNRITNTSYFVDTRVCEQGLFASQTSDPEYLLPQPLPQVLRYRHTPPCLASLFHVQ